MVICEKKFIQPPHDDHVLTNFVLAIFVDVYQGKISAKLEMLLIFL